MKMVDIRKLTTEDLNKKLEEIEAELELMADIIGNNGDVEEKRF